MALRKIWRRGQDSNLHDLSVGGFQDRCTTNYATPPLARNYNLAERSSQLVRRFVILNSPTKHETLAWQARTGAHRLQVLRFKV